MTYEKKSHRPQVLFKLLLSKLSVRHHFKPKTSSSHGSESNDRHDDNVSSVTNGSLRLLDLPEELLIRILSYFPFNHLLTYRSISHAFNTLITQSKRLQYFIALETHCLIDNPHCSRPLAERFRLLEAREEAWRLFKPYFMKTIDVTHNSSWVNDLNTGIFLLGDSINREKVIASNGSLVWATKAISCLTLQSMGFYAIGHTNTWKSFNLGKDIINARMAVDEHDLIALVTTRPDNNRTFSVIEIQLLQYSTGNPHPSATLPTFFVTHAKQEARRPGISLEILGRRLAIFVAYGTFVEGLCDEFVLFDWMNGTIVLTSQFPFRTYHALTFLSAQFIVLPNIANGALDIFQIPPQSDTSEDRRLLVHACSLILPRLRRAFYYRLIDCRADSKNISPTDSHKDNQGLSLVEPCPIFPHTLQPFRPTPSDSLVVFHVGVQNRDDNAWGTEGMRVYTLITHREALLAFANPSSPLPQPSTYTPAFMWSRFHPRKVTIPWNDWGPKFSHLFDSHHVPTRLITVSSGERYVRLARDRRIHLLDFNPHHVRRELARTSIDAAVDASASPYAYAFRISSAVEVVHGKTLLKHGRESNPWRKSVYTELPYVHTISKDRYPTICAALIDGERIIGIKLNHLDNITLIRVLHFG